MTCCVFSDRHEYKNGKIIRDLHFVARSFHHASLKIGRRVIELLIDEIYLPSISSLENQDHARLQLNTR